MCKKRRPLTCKSPKEVHCHYRDLQLPSDWFHCKCHFSWCCHSSCPSISKLMQTERYLTTWDECHVLLPTSGDQMQKTSTTSSTIKHWLQHHATAMLKTRNRTCIQTLCACNESQESDTKLLLLFYNWEEDTMSSCCCWPCKDFDWCFYYTAGLSSRSISSNERPLVSTTLFAIYKTAATHTAENPK